MKSWSVVALVVVSSAAAIAAEEKALFENRQVVITRGADAVIEFRYDEPDAPLILRGTWQDPPSGTLDGIAYAHREGCPPTEYRIKGVVDTTGALMVFGYEPQLTADCAQSGSSFRTMRFTKPMQRQRLEEKKKPRKPEAKPKPKPKPRPQPQPQPQPQQPYWQPWQWRT